MKKIVVIGGGFAGFNFVKNIKNKYYHITLVDKNNYIFFPPLLYQVATSFLEPSSISYPFRKMLRKKSNIHFKLGEILRIEPERKQIVLTTGELDYDYLILATGTETNYFGIESVRKKAIPMKNVNDALEMRNYLLSQLERATIFTDNLEVLRKKLTIVIAGGGPTGVEISGMLAEHISIFRKDYPEFNGINLQSSIYLVDGAAQLLSPMSKKSQENTLKALEKMGVKVILNAQVLNYKNDKVILSNGQIIETENLIWTAGVVCQVFTGLPDNCYGRGKRLLTDMYNKVEGVQDIYAIGDTCIQTTDPNFPSGHPQVAQVALQQGKTLAQNLDNLLKKRPLISFRYKDKGSMAIISRNKAVVDLPSGIHFKGTIAWLIWLFIHLMSLVQFRNRITTLYNWIIAYFTKDQALRMIIRPQHEKGSSYLSKNEIENI
ncbi:NAD(P)/FAD-dependent oxidoreductase [Elizabethkingia meningoseptica]|uniref:NAD(P)/FAD-dependent oxidoreductase n=1 Tax=Elizabethkingia meningoseptica TaxID=238 RepID=UPI003891E9EB